MGYRSNVDVVFYIRQDTSITDPLPFAALKLWVDENYPVKEARDEWGATVTYEPEQGYIHISYLDVKWYPGEHTSVVDAAFQMFHDTFDADAHSGNPSPAAYEFICVGEELNDIEDTRSDWADYRLGVRREVYFE